MILALLGLVLFVMGIVWLMVATRRSDVRYEAAKWDELRRDLGDLELEEEDEE